MVQDTTAGYATLTTDAGLVDFSGRGLLQLSGEDRVRFLNGQTTNDVASLQPGRSIYSTFVNAKGRMRADGNILGFANWLWIDTEPGLGPTLAADLDKFIIADDVQVENLESRFRRIAVIGPKAVEVLRTTGLEPPAEPGRFTEIPDGQFGPLIAFRRKFGPDVFYEIFCAADRADRLEGALRDAGAAPVEPGALELRRIELGIPRFGADMNGNTLPPEAGIESSAISYTKGCYIGQEVISRIKSVGHVNRHLVRMQFSGNSGPIPAASPLRLESAEVGRVTSAARVPGKGWIGLGYVKRGIGPDSGKLKGDGFEATILKDCSS